MVGRPQVLFRRDARRKKVSVILTDWGVRKSFHSVELLNDQTASRDDYELIWVEFYDRKPEQLQRLVGKTGRPMLDQWIVLGYPPELVYHKHRAYNAGLLAARGDVCAICESDAMFQPTFIANVIEAFQETAYAAIHVDAVRNLDVRFDPFKSPTFDEVKGPGCVNWMGTTTLGLWSEEDRLHRANYGACLAARRTDLMAIGGADEHVDYLGGSSGPLEITFRLLNRGRHERWLTNERLYQTHPWYPTSTATRKDYSGPNDGRGVPLRALHARTTRQTYPFRENPCVRRVRKSARLTEFLSLVAETPEPGWRMDGLPVSPPDFAYRVENDYRGHDLFVYRDEWFASPRGRGFDPSRADVLRAPDEEDLRLQVASRFPATPRATGRFQQFVHDLLSEPLQTLPRRVFRKAVRSLGKRRPKAPA